MSDAANLDTLARQLCEAEGFDPDETVGVELLERLTEFEQLASRTGAGRAHGKMARRLTYRKRAEQMPGASQGAADFAFLFDKASGRNQIR